MQPHIQRTKYNACVSAGHINDDVRPAATALPEVWNSVDA
jgi:hypothetical protein